MNPWEEICSRKELGRKRSGKKTNVLFLLVYSTRKKTAQQVCFIPECLQYACITCFIIIVRVISFSPLLGHTRYQGSQSVVSSSWGSRWIAHWKTIWAKVRSSAPHPQAAEAAIPRLRKQEQKRPAPVWRGLSRTHVSCAYRNFVQGGQLSNVLPVGPSVYFRTTEKFAMASGLIPATILHAVLGSAIPGGCLGDGSTESRSALQLFSIPPHFCFCLQMNSWASEGEGRGCLDPLDFEIISKKCYFFNFQG